MSVFIPQIEGVEIVYNTETGNIEGRLEIGPSHRGERLFEITSVDTGKSWKMTLAECEKQFGVQEFDEIRQGFLPHIVCIEL